MAWDFRRNEPVNQQNTQEEITALSQVAQAAENRGDTRMANLVHSEINRELDQLGELRSP
ncbi:hypothetical protein [Streptomyces iranensis]|uniref:Uncharacterized protein n=1 Tax=Streptomyces iranensis TaxID=576784 RepID=A0A060ZZH2_9ACTN|nr:hypothetical protein [Streptomyces iranensis]MBP2066725.1 hypothetical protein [Streptomyces iranensis]CDR08544.1 predicted protein [Streptomyces iranensis]